MSKKIDLIPILQKIKDGDESAVSELLSEFQPLIEATVTEFSSLLEEEEIRQLSSIALFEAARSYSRTRSANKVTFGLYAKICIRNRVLSEVRKLHPALEPMDEHNIPDNSSLEEEVLGRDSVAHTMSVVRRALTDYEKQVLLLYLEGNSYAEIAASLSKNEKSVGNAMCRIRSKLKQLL